MNERLLLALPHRQFVFTFPKLLRPYFRHNRRLFSEISWLIFAILRRFYYKAAKRPVRTGMVLAYQTSDESLRLNPHFHCLVLEGGFDERGKFVHVPLGDIQRMSEYFRRVVIKSFLKKEPINAHLATSLINWKHSGFSVDHSIRIPAFSIRAREALSQYIARAPLSLKKIGIEENGEATAVSFTSQSEIFKGKTETFPVIFSWSSPSTSRQGVSVHSALRPVCFPLQGNMAGQAPHGATGSCGVEKATAAASGSRGAALRCRESRFGF